MGKTQLKFGSMLSGCAALVAACLLPSCDMWRIGEHIQGRFITCEGVDVTKPVDGKVYRAERDGETHYYMLAPEITFHPCTDSVAPARVLAYPGIVYAENIRPTGKRHWVEVYPEYKHVFHDRYGRKVEVPCPYAMWNYKRNVDALPRNATVCLQNVKSDRRLELHTMGGGVGGAISGNGARVVEDRSKSAMAKVCSAPFTYCIDPLLNGVTTVVGVPVAAVVVGGASAVSKGCQQVVVGPEGTGQPLSPEIRALLQGANVLQLRAACKCHPLPDGSNVSYEIRRYNARQSGDGKVEEEVVPLRDVYSFGTWGANLPYLLDKKKPCVLFIDDGGLADSDFQAAVAALRAQGFRVIGRLELDAQGYHYQAIPQP